MIVKFHIILLQYFYITSLKYITNTKAPMSRRNRQQKRPFIQLSHSEDELQNSEPRKRPKLEKLKNEGVIMFKNIKTIESASKSSKKISTEMMIPWMSKSTQSINDSLLRLHNEIIDFYRYIKPSQTSHKKRMVAYEEIKNSIMEIIPDCSVEIFGSFATKLYLPDGDIDMVVLTNGKHEATDVYSKIHKHLIAQNKYTQLQYIRKSKVPLIKFVYPLDDLKVQFDISVDTMDGLYQLQYTNKMMKSFPEFKYIVFVFKCFLRIRGLAQTYTGGIGSFLLFCMILFYLQEIQRSKKYLTLGEYILQFMKFYGETDWSKTTIHIKTSMTSQRNQENNFTFSCLNPQDETHDIGKAAFKIRDVFNVFKNRGRYITGKNFSPSQSVLKQLVNPRKQCFKYYNTSKRESD